MRDLRKLSSRERAKVSRWFFKTAPGQYGAGDRFRGISVPNLRALAKKYEDIPRVTVSRLLKSPWHEDRLLALLILIREYERGDDRTRRAIHQLYLNNTRWVNNWDLVDSSAPQLVGAHLENGNRRLLRRLAKSSAVWERRIAMIATYHYIRKGDFADALVIARLLVRDDHDLIHKAVGWMLREIGKRDLRVEEQFLKKHATHMPRTMLRYAVERFPEPRRRWYLSLR